MTQRVHAVAFAVTAAFAIGAGSAAGQSQNQAPAPAPQGDQPPAFEEQVVVTASRVEEQLVNAPAAVSIITSTTIQNSPATNIGDLLRGVPGVNVTQVSARDVNINTRGATSTLATSQLALVDGRSIYLDFYGMVMWDFIPSNPREVKRIEVIRGPASAVWGANAMSGVVNVITKTPRELAAEGGSFLTIGVGGFSRSAQDVDRDAGTLFYVNGSQAQAVNDKVAYKISAGYFSQDALPRPVGTISNPFNTPYPEYTNEGTSQPKFDARVDYALADSATLTFNGGVSGTEGIIHTGIGPFDIDRGSYLSYFSAKYQKGARRVAFFTNLLTADSTNLLSRGPTGAFLPLGFNTKTFDVEAGDSRAIGTHNVLTFGGNFRHNGFDVSLAPNGDDRNEGGAFVQDEVFIGQYVRWVIGGRVDKFSSIDDAVFSPRTTLLLKPDANSSVRLSFNKAFRAPSFINNNLQTSVLNEVNLSPISPLLARFIFPVAAVGNPNLTQEALTAYEIGYTGVLNRRATITASVYWNTTEDAIFFTPATFYGPANPPPTWPAVIPPFVLGLLPTPLPSSYTYLNLGKVKDKGFELGVEAVATRDINVFVNYSYQADPVIEGFDPREANQAANNRFNAGFNVSHGRFLGNLDVSYSGSAYWQDVLDLRYAGTTDAYTLVNGMFGVRWAGDKVVTSLKVTNLGNSEVQQHIFGDVLRRQVVGEVRFAF
ncbi:MAG TPA: TonB-dependent receptor [Vicinamibacterales bacterium]|nr:TonB-dependent receptor [Vicinamibacterales bacterium]